MVNNISFFINNEPIWFTAISNNNLNLWNFWLKTNPDVNIKDSTEQTPLHWACFLKRKEMVMDLLNLGADPWCIDNEGYSPFFLAMIHPKTEYWNFDDWPVIYSSNFEIKDNSSIYYHFSSYIFKLSKNKRYDCLESLFKLIPSYKISEFALLKNNTIHNIPWVHVAYAWKDKQLARLYKEWGVDFNGVDQQGYSALEMAIVDEDMDWVNFLLENGANFNSNKNCNDYELSCLISGDNAYNIYSIMQKNNLDKNIIIETLNRTESHENKIIFLKRCFL